MCRLFAASNGGEVAQRLLRGPFRELARENDGGHGLALVRDGSLVVTKDVRSALDVPGFAGEPELATSPAVLAHVRLPFGSERDIRNTQPFLVDADRAFAHNGLVRNTAGMDAELGARAARVLGTGDSERYGHLLQKHVDEAGGDLRAGVERTVEWIGASSFTAGANFVTATREGVAALNWPYPDQLFYATGRHAAGADARGGYALVASQPLDEAHAWTPVPPGHLVEARGDDVRVTRVTDRTGSDVPWDRPDPVLTAR